MSWTYKTEKTRPIRSLGAEVFARGMKKSLADVSIEAVYLPPYMKPDLFTPFFLPWRARLSALRRALPQPAAS